LRLAPAEILQRLIRFDTTNPPGNERACIAWIEGLLREAGWATRILARDPERPNLVARLEGRGAAPPLMLFGHVDVATTAGQTWQQPPFEARNVDGWIWGRGALDMKGGMAMMLAACLRARAEGLASPGDVLFCALADEEAGSDCGARFLVERHAELFEGVRYAVSEAGFPVYFGARRVYMIRVAEKQTCLVRAVVRGPAGHGALMMRSGAMGRLGRVLTRVDSGRLPTHVTPPARLMLEALARVVPQPSGMLLRTLLVPRLTAGALPLLGERGRQLDPLLRNTVSAVAVRGGEMVNVIPTSAELHLDGRLLPGFTPEDLFRELRAKVGADLELEVVRHDPGPVGPDMSAFDTLVDILRGADPGAAVAPLLLPAVTDARFFGRLGIQTYGFLPVPLPASFDFLRTIHGADERVPADALELGAGCVYELLRRFL
jgi:acetylornithine deacetylase/succinyl-diaminopimelate desuccinylase-like protein